MEKKTRKIHVKLSIVTIPGLWDCRWLLSFSGLSVFFLFLYFKKYKNVFLCVFNYKANTGVKTPVVG